MVLDIVPKTRGNKLLLRPHPTVDQFPDGVEAKFILRSPLTDKLIIIAVHIVCQPKSLTMGEFAADQHLLRKRRKHSEKTRRAE